MKANQVNFTIIKEDDNNLTYTTLDSNKLKYNNIPNINKYYPKF